MRGSRYEGSAAVIAVHEYVETELEGEEKGDHGVAHEKLECNWRARLWQQLLVSTSLGRGGEEYVDSVFQRCSRVARSENDRLNRH